MFCTKDKTTQNECTDSDFSQSKLSHLRFALGRPSKMTGRQPRPIHSVHAEDSHLVLWEPLACWTTCPRNRWFCTADWSPETGCRRRCRSDGHPAIGWPVCTCVRSCRRPCRREEPGHPAPAEGSTATSPPSWGHWLAARLQPATRHLKTVSGMESDEDSLRGLPLLGRWRACVRACARARARVCVCVCVRAGARPCTHAHATLTNRTDGTLTQKTLCYNLLQGPRKQGLEK